MSDPHPTYPNPTIIQVTCEIAFAAQSEDRLSAGAVYPIFAAEFPEIQPVGNLNVQLVIGQPAFVPDAPQSQNAVAAYRFSTADGKRFVQISKANFVYQSSDAYTGWADFRAKFSELWSMSIKVVKPGPISKIGLRYINRIPRSEAHPNVSDWLRATPDLPEALLMSKEHFLARVESSPKPSHLRLVTTANHVATPELPSGGVILDIDRISLEQVGATAPEILEKLEILHDDVWASFSAASTDVLRQHLAGKLQ